MIAQLVAKTGVEGTDALWKKFNSMAEGFDGAHCTDYVRVGQ